MASIEALVRKTRARSSAATAQLIAKVRELLEQELRRQLAEGVSLRSFQQAVPQILEQQGLSALDPHRIETVFRTNMNAAYNAGRVKQIESTPALSATFQWLQYNAIIDGRQRPSHGAMNGRVYHRDSDVWKVWMPPNGFN